MSASDRPHGTFHADRLPTWESYATAHDLDLIGKGRERRAVFPVHNGARDSLKINVDTGAWKCHACDARGGDVLAFHRARHGLGFIEAARELGAWEDATDDAPARPAAPRPRRVAPPPTAEATDTDAWKRAAAARLWAASSRIADDGSPAALYLSGRACPLPPRGSDLRWLSDCPVFSFSGPALVGRMTLATDARQATGVHITWLRQDAGQWVRAERRYLGPKSSAVVRLWPDEAVSMGLGVAEGIETALSLAHAFAPVWACMDAGNLGALPLLGGIESLLIAADHDDAGTRAANECAARWAAAGREVGIVQPPDPRTDLNDLARAEA